MSIDKAAYDDGSMTFLFELMGPARDNRMELSRSVNDSSDMGWRAPLALPALLRFGFDLPVD